MAFALVLEDFIDGDENTRLFHLSEVLVDGRSEYAHGGREAHVCIDEWGNVVSACSDGLVEDAVIGHEFVLYEDFAQHFFGCFQSHGCHGLHQSVAVAEVFLEEVENHVAGWTVETGIHGHLSEEILEVRNE